MPEQTNEQKVIALYLAKPCEQCVSEACAQRIRPADGLDDIHCQEHWEQVCSDAYYEQIFNQQSFEAD